MNISFDNQKYIELQSKHINDRIEQFGGKLYLEGILASDNVTLTGDADDVTLNYTTQTIGQNRFFKLMMIASDGTLTPVSSAINLR